MMQRFRIMNSFFSVSRCNFLLRAGTSSLPFTMMGLALLTTPTGVPAFDGKTVIVISSPALNMVLVQFCCRRTPGLFSSPAHSTVLPFSSFTLK